MSELDRYLASEGHAHHQSAVDIIRRLEAKLDKAEHLAELMEGLADRASRDVTRLAAAISRHHTLDEWTVEQFVTLAEAQREDSEWADEEGHTLRALRAEVERLKRGDFTPEEFQALCHHRDERPGCTRAEFEQGCREYQGKLFGATRAAPQETP